MSTHDAARSSFDPTAAFPFVSMGGIHEHQIVQVGLSKREFFAMAAMQGICADGIPGAHHTPKHTARDAVAFADALIAELAGAGAK